MKKIKARIFEILTDPPEGDRVGNVIFNSILILIAVNVLVCIVETVESLGKEFPEFFWECVDMGLISPTAPSSTL